MARQTSNRLKRIQGWDDKSHTLNEILISPGLVKRNHSTADVNLRVPLARYKKGKDSRLYLNTPIMSAMMQSVTGPATHIALDRIGGLGFIYCSQGVESQAQMVYEVKNHKSGFVQSDSNLPPGATLEDAIALTAKTGHSTIAITEDGTPNGKLLGLLTDNDYHKELDHPSMRVMQKMTPIEELVTGTKGIGLDGANKKLWKNKRSTLPIITRSGHLDSLVFRKDWDQHKQNPDELIDDNKKLIAAAALNTSDYKKRVPALVEAGVDVVCFDSSSGYSEFQKDAALWVRKKYPHLIIGGGNVVDAEAFNYLATKAKLDFIKVGIGGGSICITREQNRLGKGQASAVLEVCLARDEMYRKSGIYIPTFSDGGISMDSHINAAMALGADGVMMGRYFAMCDESPPEKRTINGIPVKPYWGEGSNRARNWERYEKEGGSLHYEEGVDGWIPASGPLKDKVEITLLKLRDGMRKYGCMSVQELHAKAKMQLISAATITESGAHDLLNIENYGYDKRTWGHAA